MNPSTFAMFRFTCFQYDDIATDGECITEWIDAESIKEFWLDMLEDFPESYDSEWYALVGTKQIFKTIDWEAIASKYIERRLILESQY